MQVLIFQLLEFFNFSCLKIMEFITVGAVLFVLSLFLPSSESVSYREHAQVHNFNSTYRKVMPKHPYIKAQPEGTNQELCYCIGDVCFYCPDGLFCNIDESGCCPFPGCHDECGDLCVCPEFPSCCDDKGTCPITAPVCCDPLPFCCPVGTDCCGSTLCCNKATEDCCQDSEGTYYCGQC